MGISIPWQWCTMGGRLQAGVAQRVAQTLTPILVLLLLIGISRLHLETIGGLGSFCLLQYLWQSPCPGCGITRSVIALLHGDFAQAWHFHPGGSAVLFGLAIQFGLGLLEQFRFLTANTRLRWIRNGDICIAICLIVVWCLRIVHVLPLP
jgi:Protein of unknown function (DUF2752)